MANKNPWWEATKTVLRLVTLALPGYLIAAVTDLPESQTTVAVLFVLRFIDQYVHSHPNIKAKGLVPF